jgi:hypothetical protein
MVDETVDQFSLNPRRVECRAASEKSLSVVIHNGTAQSIKGSPRFLCIPFIPHKASPASFNIRTNITS